MADTFGQAELKTKYPVTTGLTASAKHDGRQINLVPTEGSLVARRNKVGLGKHGKGR